MSVVRVNYPVPHPQIRLLDAAAVALFTAVLAVVSWRLYEHRPPAGSVSADRWAMASFRDAIYYPLLAVRDGVNPYDTVRGDPDRYMERYPVQDTLPLYSPLLLLVFAPFAALPVEASMAAFAALNVTLILLLAWLTLRSIGRPTHFAGVFGLAALLLASQPGRAAFNAGQVALPLALATVGALAWGDRHGWRSAALVAFTTFKPTYGGPLGLLIAARRDWRSAIGGLLIGGALALAGLLVIFARSDNLSLEGVAQVLAENRSDFNRDPTVVPETNKARVDLVAALEYLLDRRFSGGVGPVAALAVLGLTGWVLWRAGRTPGGESAVSTSSALVVLAMNVCVYHNVYDLPLLVVPLAACATAAHPTWENIPAVWRRVVFGLLLLPFVNVFWTDGFHHLLTEAGLAWGTSGPSMVRWVIRWSCAANGLALATAWAILAIGGVQRRPRRDYLATMPQLTSVGL